MNGGSFWAAAAGQGWQQHQAGRLDQLSPQKIFFLSPFHLRWWLTGVLSLRADSAEMIGRPLSRWKLIRWLTESNVRSLVRTWEKARTAKFQEQIYFRESHWSSAVAQSIDRPSKVQVWCNSNDVGSNHERDMSSVSL